MRQREEFDVGPPIPPGWRWVIATMWVLITAAVSSTALIMNKVGDVDATLREQNQILQSLIQTDGRHDSTLNTYDMRIRAVETRGK